MPGELKAGLRRDTERGKTKKGTEKQIVSASPNLLKNLLLSVTVTWFPPSVPLEQSEVKKAKFENQQNAVLNKFLQLTAYGSEAGERNEVSLEIPVCRNWTTPKRTQSAYQKSLQRNCPTLRPTLISLACTLSQTALKRPFFHATRSAK